MGGCHRQPHLLSCDLQNKQKHAESVAQDYALAGSLPLDESWGGGGYRKQSPANSWRTAKTGEIHNKKSMTNNSPDVAAFLARFLAAQIYLPHDSLKIVTEILTFRQFILE